MPLSGLPLSTRRGVRSGSGRAGQAAHCASAVIKWKALLPSLKADTFDAETSAIDSGDLIVMLAILALSADLWGAQKTAEG
jgi:hypothetical protein